MAARLVEQRPDLPNAAGALERVPNDSPTRTEPRRRLTLVPPRALRGRGLPSLLPRPADAADSRRTYAMGTLADVATFLLRPYARIVFSRDPRVGALMFAAVATRPWVGAATLGAVLVAHCIARLFGLGAQTTKEGSTATTAVLAVLALAYFGPPENPVWLLLPAAVLAVFLEAGCETAFAGLALPTHAGPFVLTSWIVMLAARGLPLSSTPSEWNTVAAGLPAWSTASGPLDVAAAIVFSNGALAGALVATAIALHSRIALLLAGAGSLVAFAAHAGLRASAEWSWLDVTASFNAILTAMAVGGVWFVPSGSSLLLAALGAGAATIVTYALMPVAGALFLPVLSLPFVLTTHLVLLAARRRERDKSPASTVPGDRPEDSLAKHLMRVRRFGEAAWLPFRLPFRGQWVVTQGNDGQHTHRDQWRFGFDFEVAPLGGAPDAGQHSELRNYACYGLPVLAAGAGSVVSVVDGIEDNPPGEVNTHDVWGNVVVIAHGVGLYSAYAHLQPGSISVRPGETVTAGKEIGRCGSSGRSPVPHLHFQLQRSHVMGSATIPVEFGDVVRGQRDSARLELHGIPNEGDVVRPVVRDEALVRALAWSPGERFELSETDLTELVTSEVDLLGRRSLSSKLGRLWFELYDGGLVLLDFQGSPDSLLRSLLLALPRVPFDRATSLTWREQLPRRLFLPVWARSLGDLLAALGLDLGAQTVSCQVRRAPGAVVVQSSSERWSTEAELSLVGRAHRFRLHTEQAVRELVLRRTEGTYSRPTQLPVVREQESMA
jgi:murein DD-endopeptidase MepM/ murein hydrolase activator NlpD/urea transporter